MKAHLRGQCSYGFFSMSEATATDWGSRLEPIVKSVIAPAASEIDRSGAFPRAALDAMGKAGLLGLLGSPEIGGMGGAHRAAAGVVERIARDCASTAMITCMHYCGAAAIEKLGPRDVREAIVRGKHLTTLAFSEVGSRSHFWAPLGTAVRVGGGVRLDAQKSWSTSAGQVDSYVWSSKPMAAEGHATVWLMPGKAAGLTVGAPFDGLGLRGNHSSPVTAAGVLIPQQAMLGTDGNGPDVMQGIILPYFTAMNAAGSIGLCEAAIEKTIAHMTRTRFEHLGQTLADQPVARANLAHMRIKTDMARALLDDTLTALETGRADAMLRVLEVKAAAGEAALEVTDLAMRLGGGAAFRKEVGLERHFRDARASTIMGPTADSLRDFIGRVLTGLPLIG
jgi:alkylation response protein AidB-like acyl-CoA dehydrogenase